MDMYNSFAVEFALTQPGGIEYLDGIDFAQRYRQQVKVSVIKKIYIEAGAVNK
jgi:hypothetical protein